MRDSLAIFVADPFPIDQYYVNHSEELFSHAMEDLVIDTESAVILEGVYNDLCLNKINFSSAFTMRCT